MTGATPAGAAAPISRQRGLAPAIWASIGVHAAAPLAWLAAPGEIGWIAGALVANHAVLTAAGMSPRCRLLGPNLRRLPQEPARRGEVALTFDDGPDPAVTPSVLDMLEAAGARASFFCIGANAARYPALAREIVRRGHSVENHTATHPKYFACLPPCAIAREIGGAQSALADITGVAPAYFRPPMGLRSPLFDPVLARTELRHISWTRRALDGVFGDPHTALQRLTRNLAGGDVLLMHDGRCARTRQGVPVVLELLPRLLGCIKAAGLRAGSLSQACDDCGAAAAASLAGGPATRLPPGEYACR